MANPFRKLPPHSPVTAFSITVWNRMIDMLNWWETSRSARGGPVGIGDWDQSVFRCRNDTGGDLASYAVVGIDGPIWAPSDGDAELAEFRNQTSIKGVTPAVADHRGKWGVMLEATPEGAIGRCCLAGVLPVRIYCDSYKHTRCDIVTAKTVDSETVYLGSRAFGTRILWWEATGSGDEGTIVSGIVRLGDVGPLSIFGKLKATLSPGGSADIDVYEWSGAAWTDTGWDLTVYAPPHFTTGTIASAKWVQVMYDEQAVRDHAIAREC